MSLTSGLEESGLGAAFADDSALAASIRTPLHPFKVDSRMIFISLFLYEHTTAVVAKGGA